MNRFLRHTTLGMALCAVVAAAGSGCMVGNDLEVGGNSSGLTASPDVRFLTCSSLASRLRGLEVEVYMVRDDWSLVVLQRGGLVLCVDYPDGVRQAGVIPVVNLDEPACSFCEGTPLPAEIILGNGEPKDTHHSATVPSR